MGILAGKKVIILTALGEIREFRCQACPGFAGAMLRVQI